MSIFGQIGDASLGSVLQWGAIERMTGVVSVSSPSGMGRMFLREGKLVYAVDQNGRLRAELLARDLIPAEVLFSERAPAGESSLVQTALNHGVDEETVRGLLRQITIDSTRVILGWRTGTFSIDTHHHLDDPSGVFQEGLSVESLLVDAARVSDEREAREESMKKEELA